MENGIIVSFILDLSVMYYLDDGISVYSKGRKAVIYCGIAYVAFGNTVFHLFVVSS